MTINNLLHKYPSLPDGTNIHLWPGKAFIKYRKTISTPAITWSVNESAGNILRLFDGQNSIKDIISKLANAYGTAELEVESKLQDFIHELEKRIPITFNDFPASKGVHITGNKNYISPMHASIELTYRCNLKCKHCYIEGGLDRSEIMDCENAHALLNMLFEWGVSVIELTGGEPTLFPGFNDLLIHAAEMFDLVGIVTNGTLLSQQTLDIISQHQNKIAIQIDLHGSEEEYVDWFTGSNNVLAREIDAIKKVSETGSLLRVVMVVTPLSLSQMRSTATLAKELGATVFGMSPIIPQGRGSDTSLLFTEQQMLEYLNIMKDLSTELGDFIFHLEESPFTLAASQNHCGAGARTITITPSGDIKICQMSSADLLSFGNIFSDKPEILFGKEAAKRLSCVIPPNNESCVSCNNIAFCFSCINRGLIMANRIGPDGCNWYSRLAFDFLGKSN